MTLHGIVRHLNLRRIAILHLRDNIVTFRPPPLHGVRFDRAHAYVGNPSPAPLAWGRRGRRARTRLLPGPRRSDAATLTELVLETADLPNREVARGAFSRAARGLHAYWRELAWRIYRPRERPSPLPDGIFARWVWRCGPSSRLRIWLQYGRRATGFLELRRQRHRTRHRSRAADSAARYSVSLHVGAEASAPPLPSLHSKMRFSPLRQSFGRAGADAISRRLAGRHFGDEWGRADMTLLPNGHVVILGSAGASGQITGTWRIAPAPPTASLRITLASEAFYQRAQRYQVGRCARTDSGPGGPDAGVLCLRGVSPPQLPTWLGAAATHRPSSRL